MFIPVVLCAQSGENSLHEKFDSILPINPGKAYEIALEEINLAKQAKDPFLLGLGYHDMGNALWLLGEHPEGLKYYLKAIQKFEEINNLWGQVITYNDMSLIHIELENYQESISDLYKAKKINHTLKDTTLETIIHINLAESFINIDELDSALIHLEMAQKIVYASRNQNYRYGILHNLGRVYHKLEVDNLAYSSFSQAKLLAEESNDPRYLSEILIHVGEYFLDNNELDSANNVLRQALYIANELGSEKRALDAVRLIQQNYELTGKVDSAFKYSKLRLNLRTVIAGAEKIRRLDNLLFLEELRQRELEEEREQMKEARRHLLEYLFIT
jgi:tetratricopeptide (TPR) repeat protein